MEQLGRSLLHGKPDVGAEDLVASTLAALLRPSRREPRAQRLGEPVRRLFVHAGEDLAGVGSVLLIPELLSKPLRAGTPEDLAVLSSLLARLDLRPVDTATAELAAALGASLTDS